MDPSRKSIALFCFILLFFLTEPAYAHCFSPVAVFLFLGFIAVGLLAGISTIVITVQLIQMKEGNENVSEKAITAGKILLILGMASVLSIFAPGIHIIIIVPLFTVGSLIFVAIFGKKSRIWVLSGTILILIAMILLYSSMPNQTPYTD